MKNVFQIFARVQLVSKETEEALNCILPAREWLEDGVLWRQKVIIRS